MNLQYSLQIPIPVGSKKKYPSNYVSTTKYNILTFLPLALILQFRRYANIYFLTVATLQSIPLISPLSPISAILPLVFVLSLSMTRQGFEDYARYKSDQQNNSSKTHVFRQKDLKNVAWSTIKPGDLVKVYEGEPIPVDMVPLYCSEQSGISYVETSSLDGEKNLKPKISLTQTQLEYNRIKEDFLSDMSCQAFCDLPDADINRFNARIILNFGKNKLSSDLNHKNLLLRGTKLKNTGWVVGLTIYTGKNTKIMQNGCSATTKVSNIQRKVNGIIIYIMLFELLCCSISTIYCYVKCMQLLIWQNMIRGISTANCSQITGIAFGSYFILYSTFIPISLIVSLEFVKVFQGRTMNKDKQMYCALNDRSMQCHTVSINEQLGQIEYILTDKTGTLTCNKMQFKNVIIGNNVYGEEIKLLEIDKNFDYSLLAKRFNKPNPKNKNKIHEDVQYSGQDFLRGISFELSLPQENSFQSQDISRSQTLNTQAFQRKNNLQNSNKESLMNSEQNAHRKQIELMFFIMTTCHECLRETKDIFTTNNQTQNNDTKLNLHQRQDQQMSSIHKQSHSYHGPSPDEVALLNAAKKIGFEFIKTENKVTTVLYKQKYHQFKILKMIEFDSDRKRMTVLVQWEQTTFVFVKGADTSIKALLCPDQKYLQFITEKTKTMAKTGLRSLWFAFKTIPSQVNIAEISVQQLEKDLILLGATGIEDRLQDFVPETIYSLRQGGIKFVMLTGDKIETAQNIARSCKMIEQGFLIQNSNKLKEGSKIIKEAKQLDNKSICPVIDGSAINFTAYQNQLLQIIQISASAVFCRVTPNQKAEIVKIVKKLGKLTLAIGDGANDVNMILQAHVGVGIFGQEGVRAAQVSNYAIGQFCLLWKLLLYYGRLNYMRISQMILYFFYKNMVFTIVQFAFSFYNLGSGQSFWFSWSITFYNMIFTFFPVVLRAVFEIDVNVVTNKHRLKQLKEGNHSNAVLYSYYPKMYLISQRNQLFTNFVFFQWFSLGISQGVLCLMITLYSIDGISDSSGYNSYGTGFYFAQLSAYTSVIVVVTLKLAINVRNWNVLLIVGFLVPSLGAYIVYCVLLNFVPIENVEHYFSQIITMPSFYLSNILAILGMFSVDLFLFSIEAFRYNFQNYFKNRAMTGRNMTQANLAHLINKMQNKSIPTSNRTSNGE